MSPCTSRDLNAFDVPGSESLDMPAFIEAAQFLLDVLQNEPPTPKVDESAPLAELVVPPSPSTKKAVDTAVQQNPRPTLYLPYQSPEETIVYSALENNRRKRLRKAESEMSYLSHHSAASNIFLECFN